MNILTGRKCFEIGIGFFGVEPPFKETRVGFNPDTESLVPTLTVLLVLEERLSNIGRDPPAPANPYRRDRGTSSNIGSVDLPIAHFSPCNWNWRRWWHL